MHCRNGVESSRLSGKHKERPLKTRVILVRHGQSSYNQRRLIQGHCDESTLTPEGVAQADVVGQALAGIPFDAIWSSPLQRAKMTTERVLAQLRQTVPALPEPHYTDDLKEISLPLWEGIPFTEAEANHPEEYRAWRQDPANLVMTMPTPEGGRRDFYPVRALYEQAAAGWQRLLAAHPGQTILVVAHSAINRALISTALGLGPERMNNLYQANCAINVLNVPAGVEQPAQLESMNLTGHLEQPLPPLRTSHRGPRLLLVRHGETEWNRQQRFQGQIDVPLNETGRRQGQQVAQFLRALTLDAAYSSPMARPQETAELILAHHPQLSLQLVEDLKEISHGEWEGKYEAEIEAGYPGMLQQWQQAPDTVQMPAGENLQQVWQRAISAWKQIVAAHSGGDRVQTVMVVAHDAINKAILCHVVGWGPEAFWRFKQGNGAVSVIDYPNGVDSSPVLSAVNITRHLSGSVLDKTAAGAL
ncbi:histidine phosphatase family protein [Halomicronema hongdechloris C2206]|uniref:Histidine phosphatase family protein n=1 Tax=Halomicronema hongdechloris C2206 TaxID=1641165 RepID=A0A1Z3HKC0_9CYAN|nr:histidine phosphatase family protein [Halomicronema hongdechloris C2206]